MRLIRKPGWLLLLPLIWMLAVSSVTAQDWNLTLNINPYPSPYISDWENNPTSVGQATAYNNTNTGQEVTLFVQLVKSGEGLLVDAESPPIFMNQLSTRILNNTEFIEFSTADYKDPSIKNRVFRTGRLPAGTYTACAVIRDLSGASLSTQVCQDFEIVYPEPPQLIFPNNEGEVTSEFPTFQWIPVTVPADYSLTYQMKIVEVLDSQAPLRALEANVPLFEREGISGTNLSYPLDALPLEEGTTYAWRIQALDQYGMAPAANQGYSEIFTFTYNPPTAAADTVAADTTAEEEETAEETEPLADRETPPGPCIAETDASLPGGSPADRSFSEGEEIQIGNFVLSLTSVSPTSNTGNGLSGEGTIDVPFFNADINVEFEGLEVNGDGAVISGEAYATIDPAAGISSSLIDRLRNEGVISEGELTQLQETAAQSERLVRSFTGGETVSLPIGYNRPISGRQFVIGVYSMTFSPTNAEANTGFQLELPELGPGTNLNFQQKVAFHPNGLGDQVEMFLAEDFGVDRGDSWSFTFKAPDLESAVSDSGTYVSWGCDGFKEVRVKADVEFPRDWFTPDPDDSGAPAKAEFVTRIRDGSGWMATANMDPVRFTGAPGFGMEVTDMVFDFSDSENPADITFPDTFEGITGPDWKGFYIQTANIRLPSKIQTFEGSPPSPSVSNLLIDDSGFTASVLVENLIRGETADFGGWAGSIEELGLDFVSSSLQNGHMNGGIRLPVSDDALDYEALLNVVHESEAETEEEEGDLEYQFTITPVGSYNVPMWSANLELYETTYISLVDTSETEGFQADANLSGAFTIDGAIGNASKKIPGVNFSGLEFQNLRLRNQEPYASIGTWGFASPQKSMGGFPISIDKIEPLLEFADDGNPLLGLGFEIEANLMSETIAGSTYVSLYGKMNVIGEERMSAEFHDVRLDSIGIHAELSAVTIDGRIVFYYDDPTFGNGFRGGIEATFLQEFTIESTAQFGSVDGFRYWYVDAMVQFGTGITAFPSTDIYGFGGAVWYHMSRAGPDPRGAPHEFSSEVDDSSTPSAEASSGYRFEPDESISLGLKAMITLGSTGDPKAFNVDASLSAEFSGSAIRTVTLRGDIYMLADLPEREKARVTGFGEMSFDFEHKRFTAIFEVDVDIKPLIASGRIDILFAPEAWHIKVGDPFAGPDGRIQASLAWLNISGYFMVGTDLPGIPPPPDEAISILEEAGIDYTSPPRSEGDGIVLGAAAAFDTGDQTFLIFFGRIAATLGFDFALRKDLELECGEGADIDGEIGANGWYASGQVYAALGAEIGIKIKLVFVNKRFTIFSAWVGAIIQGGGPNPTWFSGQVSGKYNVLGIVKGSFSFRFKKGTVCTPVAENPLLAIDIISDMKPDSNATEPVPVDFDPKVAFNIAVNEPFELRQTISTEDSIYSKIRTFRIKIDEFTIKEAGSPGNLPTRAVRVMEDGTMARLFPEQMLKGETEHISRIDVFGEEYLPVHSFKDAGFGPFEWDTTRDSDGNPVTESRATSFTTGPRPDSILSRHVSYTYPLTRQRYFLQDEEGIGVVQLEENYDYLFNGEPDEEGYREVYVARFIPVLGGEEIETEARYESGPRRVVFDMPELHNSTIYAVQIVAKQVEIKTFQEEIAEQAGLGEGNATNPFVNKALREVYTDNLRNRLNNIYGGAIPDSLLEGTTLQERKRTIPGTVERSNEHLYYYFHFRTSQFNTLAQKMYSTTVDRVNYSNFFNIEDVEVQFTAPEYFDQFDLYGVEYQTVLDRTETFGPLIKARSFYRNSTWHRWYAMPFVYEPLQTMKELGPFTKYESFSGPFGLPMYRSVTWRWNEPIHFDPYYNADALARYNSSGRPPLSDSELLPEPASEAGDDSDTAIHVTSVGGEIVTDESTGVSGAVSSSDLGMSGGGMFDSSSLSVDGISADALEPRLLVKYRHPYTVLLDYVTAENEASYLLSEFRDFLSIEQRRILNRAMWIDYNRLYSGRYRMQFYYDGLTGPPHYIDKWFNYEKD